MCSTSSSNANLSAHFVTGLPKLPDFAVLSPLVTTCLGLNPGKMTLTGTNTYLVGTGSSRILIDTGEGRAGYIENLETAMEACGATSIQEIIITHRHYDHTGGIPQLHERFGGSIPVRKLVDKDVEAEAYTPIHDGDILRTEGATLRVVATPGHCSDHVCFVLEEENALFSGDCVLGAGSAVFENLSQYMSSLQRLLDLHPGRIYPAHGPVVENGKQQISTYISHRMARERQIVDRLRTDGDQTTKQLVDAIYADTPEHLKMAAASNLLLHLDKLQFEGRVLRSETNGDSSTDTIWRLVASSSSSSSS